MNGNYAIFGSLIFVYSVQVRPVLVDPQRGRIELEGTGKMYPARSGVWNQSRDAPRSTCVLQRGSNALERCCWLSPTGSGITIAISFILSFILHDNLTITQHGSETPSELLVRTLEGHHV